MDVTADPPHVRRPTLLAWGRRDWTVPLCCGETLHRLIPDSELYISRDGSHDWLMTHPAEFAAAILAFLSK